MAWSKGLTTEYYTIRYKWDFGPWQDSTLEFDNYVDAFEFCDDNYHQYEIFKINKECVQTNPKYE